MKKNYFLKFVILSISFLMMIRLTISPALAEIGKAFPEQNQGSLMFMVTLASLVAIPFGLLSGILSSFMKKKPLVILGLVIYIIGGMGPMFANNFTFIIICRCLLGAGTGFFLPMATGLIADFFEGDERNRLLGYQSTAVALGNIVTSVLAGALATILWRYSFLIYAFAIIVLLLVIFKLPEPAKVERGPAEKKVINFRVVFICVATMIYAIIYFAYFGLLSFVVDGRGFGNAASTGIANMLMTAASLVMGLFFGLFTRIFKKFNLILGILLNVIGFGLLAFASNMAHIFIASLIIGVGFGIVLPTAVMKVTDASPKSQETFSNGLLMTFVNIGTAVSSGLLVVIGNIFGNNDGQFLYRIMAIALLIGMVISIVLAFVKPAASKDKAAEMN